MNALTYTKSGTKASTNTTLDKAVFGLDVDNHELIKQAYTMYLANGRENLAVTKTRGLVRGGGKKPWRQKGTGRARFGSIRVPLWRGGGITFGPTGQENYSKKMHVKAKRQAIRQALSLAANQKQVSVIDSISLKEAKTNELAKLLNKLGAKRQTLLVVADIDQKISRASANLSEVKVVQPNYLNVFDVVNAYNIIIEKKALDTISSWLNPSNSDKPAPAKKATATNTAKDTAKGEAK